MLTLCDELTGSRPSHMKRPIKQLERETDEYRELVSKFCTPEHSMDYTAIQLSVIRSFNEIPLQPTTEHDRNVKLMYIIGKSILNDVDKMTEIPPQMHQIIRHVYDAVKACRITPEPAIQYGIDFLDTLYQALDDQL